MRRKIEYFMYSLYDYTGMELHFEEMARKGWELRRMGMFLHYRRTEPCNVKYAVTYLPESGVYSPKSERDMTFEEYCESAGWEFAADNGGVKVFRNRQADAVPLETQPDIQVENIHRATLRGRIGSWILAGAGCIWLLWMWISCMKDSVDFLSNDLYWMLALVFLPMGVWGAADLVTYYRWYYRAKENAEQNQLFTPVRGYRYLQIAMMLICAAGVLAGCFCKGGSLGAEMGLRFLGIFAAWYVMDLIVPWMRNRGSNAAFTVIVTSVIVMIVLSPFYIGGAMMATNQIPEDGCYNRDGFRWQSEGWQLPILKEELTGEDGPFAVSEFEKQCRTQSTFLLSCLSAEDSWSGLYTPAGEYKEEQSYLQYVVAKEKMSFLHEHIWNSMRETYDLDQEWRPADGWQLPESAEACQISYEKEGQQISRYLIRMKDRVILIDLDFVPDEGQKEQIMEKLGTI